MIPPSKTNITMEHPPGMKMYFLLKIKIFHPVMFVNSGVYPICFRCELFVVSRPYKIQPQIPSEKYYMVSNRESPRFQGFTIFAMLVSGRVISPDMIRPAISRGFGWTVGDGEMDPRHYHIKEIKLYKTRVKPQRDYLDVPLEVRING